MAHCTGIVLAAGSSRRFGSDKRLYKLANNQPLAIATLSVWSEAIGVDGLADLYVVTRGWPQQQLKTQKHRAIPPDPLVDVIAANKGLNVTIISADDSELGMGHSLAAAMDRLAPGPVIVGLADMPYLQVSTIKQIATRLTAAPTDTIVRPSYQGRSGNPVGFGAAHHHALARCRGDSGAKAVVQAATRKGQVIDLPVNDSGVVHDIDRPSDAGPAPI